MVECYSRLYDPDLLDKSSRFLVCSDAGATLFVDAYATNIDG